MPDNNTYLQFVQEVKQQILQSRYQASKLVNKELLMLYLNIGRILHEKSKRTKWGDEVPPNISADLEKELPGLKGFSFYNLKNMQKFLRLMLRLQLGRRMSANYRLQKKSRLSLLMPKL